MVEESGIKLAKKCHLLSKLPLTKTKAMNDVANKENSFKMTF